jgi:hypothetical protein
MLLNMIHVRFALQ